MPAPVPGYRLDRPLGRGRASRVLLARRQADGAPVALKLARRAGDGFAAECALARALPHRHILQAFDHGRTAAGEAWLAMEYAAGGALAPQKLAPAQVLSIAAQAAQALAALHAAGWVHRDVKPANLLLRADGSVALADFGSACRTGQLPRQAAGSVIGSPRYAAPEQSQAACASPAADVYSLGVLLHELLTGEAPFPGETLTELMCQHLAAPVPRLPAALAAWQPLLDAMLAKRPESRPADGQALLARLPAHAPLGSLAGATP